MITMDNCKHVLYASCLCSMRLENKILKRNPKAIGIQIQKYHRLLVKGLASNGISVEAMSHHKAIETIEDGIRNEIEDGIQYRYIGVDNSNYINTLLNSFVTAQRYFKNNKDADLVCDVLNFTISLGSALSARLSGRKVIGIITDFPEQLYGQRSGFSLAVWMLIRICTGYVVLTEQMKERLDDRKPAIVLEGHVDSKMEMKANTLNNKYEKKVCLYAGMLHKRYGIEKLVQAFSALDKDEAELHVYGDGDYAQELRGINSQAIKYFGIAPNETVVNEEIKATLLINPRPTDEEFTKYSFPSKNMEYMASGTPLLTTNLPGMPKEYLQYVYTFEDESVEGMTKTLKTVLSESREALHERGRIARQFVLKEKSETTQARKMIDVLLK